MPSTTSERLARLASFADKLEDVFLTDQADRDSFQADAVESAQSLRNLLPDLTTEQAIGVSYYVAMLAQCVASDCLRDGEVPPAEIVALVWGHAAIAKELAKGLSSDAADAA